MSRRTPFWTLNLGAGIGLIIFGKYKSGWSPHVNRSWAHLRVVPMPSTSIVANSMATCSRTLRHQGRYRLPLSPHALRSLPLSFHHSFTHQVMKLPPPFFHATPPVVIIELCCILFHWATTPSHSSHSSWAGVGPEEPVPSSDFDLHHCTDVFTGEGHCHALVSPSLLRVSCVWAPSSFPFYCKTLPTTRVAYTIVKAIATGEIFPHPSTPCSARVLVIMPCQAGAPHIGDGRVAAPALPRLSASQCWHHRRASARVPAAWWPRSGALCHLLW
jgi:hypothetical protein